MKTCPNCKELLGDSVENCFNCKYSFVLKRIVTAQERNQTLLEKQEAKKQLELEYETNRIKNAIFEYDVVVMRDSSKGAFDTTEYCKILQQYASQGWQLKFVFTNELGKNSSSIGYGGVSVGTNSTIEETILTFERCIKPSSFN